MIEPTMLDKITMVLIAIKFGFDLYYWLIKKIDWKGGGNNG